MRGVVMENNPLSKRGTSQKLENKELEISVVERSLATVVNQYMFVDQSVRPIKVCLSVARHAKVSLSRGLTEPLLSCLI